jgi:hypothetical protein
MESETLKMYILSERTRGIPDEAIRIELLKTGWKEGDVQQALRVNSKEQVSISLGERLSTFAPHSPEVASMKFLRIGALLFLLSSVALVLSGKGLNTETNPLFLAFALTHGANTVAAYFLFCAVWRLSHTIMFRIWIVLLAVSVASFALLSFLHFLSIGAGIDLFNQLQKVLLGDDYLPLIIYFVLLPLQAVVFLAMAITLWGLRLYRRHKGQEPPRLRPYMHVIGSFFVIALIAIGDLFFVLEHSRFGF